jgi:uncharacterized protein DUF839
MLMFRARRSILATIAAGALAAAVVASVASGGPNAAGYNTTQAAMVSFATTPSSGAPATSKADAIISVGDTIGGYTFESIPDGVSVYPRGNGRADVYVNHETSTVPFPFASAWPQAGGVELNQNDFTNSEVSLFEMKPNTVEINKASKAIASSQNLHRFCANFLATAAEGFKHPILFANEEAQDWVFRTGTSWPGPTFIAPATPGAEQLGVVFAHDVKSGKTKPIYGMGRHNHESAVAIPGFDDIVVLSGDDTFQTNPPLAASQLYMYTAADSDELWDDAGTLNAFVADNMADNDYFDLQAGETIEGKFLPVPEDIAKGKDPDDGHELTRAVDFPNYAAPAGGPSLPPDGPQWVLDQWGNVNPMPNTPDVGDVTDNDNDVFDFIRIEDIAYDKNDPNVVYIADSGRATAGAANPLTTSTNGRIYKLVLDPDDPTVAKISILVQGDDVATVATDPVGSLGEIHQPDNLETTVNGNLLVTEDPSGNNQYNLPAAPGTKTSARLWMVPVANPEAGKKPLLEVNQALDENLIPANGAVDVDAAGAARLGAWESSGIVDASAAFGPGTFFLTIQAHSYWIQKLAGPDRLDAAGNPNPNTNGPDFFYKKEGGQLILLTMPGI